MPQIAVVGNFPQPSLGRLIELKPDLILAGGLPDAQMIHQLGRIAPTVVTYKLGDTWRTALEISAAALGDPNAAQRVVDKYRSHAQAVARSLCVEPGTTVSICAGTRAGRLICTTMRSRAQSCAISV